VRTLALLTLLAGLAAAAPAGEDIRDVRGPVHIPAPAPWGWYAAAACALALAGAGVLLWRRRRVRARSAHERAFARLEAARALMDPARARLYATAVSDAVRAYLEERFRVPAGRRTSHEFLASVAAAPPPLLRDHLAGLRELLDFSDRAKFGGWLLAPAQMEGMYACAWRLVETTHRAEEGGKS